jgi:bacterioferritin (cytochrome b1)
MQVLDPLRIGQNVKEIIECDLAAEIGARTLYQEGQRTATASRTMSHATCSKA